MNAKSILKELKAFGSETYKKLLFKNYGVREPCFGVKIGDLKKIQKRIKKDYQLALDLYDTGNYDAMYLAGLIADDARMTKKDLQRWVENAYAGSLPGATVPWVAAGSPHGREVALNWIESKKPHVASAGWMTLASLVSIKDDADLDIAELKALMQRVQKTIHKAPDAVRYSMNSFLISVGSYVKPLTLGDHCRREDRTGARVPWKKQLRRSLRAGLHSQSAEARLDWQKAQIGEMLERVAWARSIGND